MIKQFYLLYTPEMDFRELDNRSDYEFHMEAARIFGRPYYQIHGDSVGADPIIELLVITDEPMNQARAMELDQAATNWLHETNRWKFKRAR